MEDKRGLAPLTIRLLGKPTITYEGQSLTFRTRKVLALFIYLVVEGGVHSRASLMALLWPESTAESAAATLRGTLSRLRKSLQLAGEFIISEGDSVGFDYEASFDLDLVWLAAAARSDKPPNELTAILTLDRGEFLAGFSLPDTPDFDTWAAIQGEACQRQLDAVYDRLTQHQLSTHDIASAVETASRWVARAPYSEVAYRRLMAAQALAGDRPTALKSFEKLQEMLKREFEIEPARETSVLAEQIRDREFGFRILDFGLTDQDSKIRDRSSAMPFVGRAEEHSQLVAAFGQTGEERARVVTLIGAAGVGKTRLVEAFQEWVTLNSPGVEIWQGRAFEMGGHLPYQAVIEAMRPRLEQENAPEDLLDDVWLAELSQLMPELRARYPDLPPPMTGNADFVRSRLFEALTTLGSSLVTSRPAVFILDDMQWADAETRDMIHYLARRWAEMGKPILLLLTVRQESFAADTSLREWLARLERDVPLQRLLLDSLSGSDVKQLVAHLAGASSEAETTNAFGEWLWAETRGLPFFIEALLQMLVEQGTLTRSGEQAGEVDFSVALHHVQSITKLLLPPGVREVIRARLAQHSEEAGALLLAASVLGRACSYRRLCQVADLDELLALKAVETLLDSRLLAERPAARRPYSLAHDYIREVIYSESHEVRRRVFHRRALLALEADRAPAAECAFHALTSLLDEPTFRFSLAAGDEALASYALQESLVHYDNARQAARGMLEQQEALDSQSLRKLYQNRGRALELVDDYPAAQKNYEEMREVATSQQDRTMVLAGLTAQCIIQANHTTVFDPTMARELGEAALDLARELKDRAAESAALQGMMLVENYGGGDDRKTLAYGQQSLAIARELGLKEQMGSVMLNLCWPYLAQIQLEEALGVNSEALAIWQTLGNQQMLLETNTMRLFLLSGTGDLEGTLATAQEALRLSRLTGSQTYQQSSTQFMGRVLSSQGQFGLALANLEAALAMSEARNHPYAKQGNYDSLIAFYLLIGAPKQADRWADKLHEALQLSSMPVWYYPFLVSVAEAKIACGKVVEGQAMLAEAIEGYEWQTSWSHVLIPMLIADAHLQMALGKPERVFSIREDQLQELREAGFGYRLAEELWVRGKTLLAMDKIGQAKQTLMKAVAAAGEHNERAILWQILATLSDLERRCGNKAEAEKLHGQAREIIDYISEHAGTDELRSTFLAQPSVLRILNRRQ